MGIVRITPHRKQATMVTFFVMIIVIVRAVVDRAVDRMCSTNGYNTVPRADDFHLCSRLHNIHAVAARTRLLVFFLHNVVYRLL